jgi:hypothetical protein
MREGKFKNTENLSNRPIQAIKKDYFYWNASIKRKKRQISMTMLMYWKNSFVELWIRRKLS